MVFIQMICTLYELQHIVYVASFFLKGANEMDTPVKS